MNTTIPELLGAAGLARLARRHRKTLIRLFLLSVGLHLALLAALGGWIVMRAPSSRPPSFQAAPPVKRYDPRPLEWRVKLSKRQRSSSRPAPLTRLNALAKVTLAMPETPPRPQTPLNVFRPRPSLFSGKGFAAGIGDGHGKSGFNGGLSTVDFVGIPASGEKIAILVDVSVSMVEPERGGAAGYARVKQRIDDVIDSLNESTLFSLTLFADAARVMETNMIVASPANKTRAKLFLRPYNTEGNWGLTDGNVREDPAGLRGHGGTTRLDLALTAACRQGADTILVFSDGMPRVRKAWSAEQRQAFQEQRAAWMHEHADAVAAWDASRAAATVERVWVPPTPARPPSSGPPREGEPIDRGSPAQPGRWVTRHSAHHAGARPEPPPIPDPGHWTLADFVEHIRRLHRHHYTARGQKSPVVHCIGYQIDREGSAFLEGLAENHQGKYRRVTRLARR